MKFSLFPNVKARTTSSISINDYLKKVKSTDPNDDNFVEVMRLRQIKRDRPAEYKAAKEKSKPKLEMVTCSGVFAGGHEAKDLEVHSGLIAIDLDDQDYPDGETQENIRNRLKIDPYTFVMHSSLSGTGLVVLVKINPQKHLESFFGLEKYYASNYGLTIDQKCKDVGRCRFVAYDENIFFNNKSDVFKLYLKKSENYTEHKKVIFTDNDLKFIIKQLKEREIDLVDDYDDWFKIGMSLATIGERGRAIFHEVSKLNSKYSKVLCDKKFSGFIDQPRDISMGTFFFYVKAAGCDIHTQETKDIMRTAALMKKMGYTEEQAVKSILHEEVDKETAPQLVRDLYRTLPSTSYAVDNREEIYPTLIKYVKHLRTSYNSITKMYEWDGREVTDQLLNTMFLDAVQVIHPELRKNQFQTVVESEVSRTYNPIRRFLKTAVDEFPDADSTSTIQSVCDCFVFDNMPKEKSDLYLTKWLHGFISSAMGTHSVLFLLLCGGQNVRKTSFFENLLPKELSGYRSRYIFNEKFDTIVAMSRNWLLYDDEFGGKTKEDERVIKRLTSTQSQVGRKAYGHFEERYERLAIMGGNSNEFNVLNDPTGNRRFIPLNVKSFDFDRFEKIDKVQLFAELTHQWKKDPKWFWLSVDEVQYLNEISDGSNVPNKEEELLLKYFSIPKSPQKEDALNSMPYNELMEHLNHTNNAEVITMSSTELFVYLRKVSALPLNHRILGMILRKHGFVRRQLKISGVRSWKYIVIKNQIDTGIPEIDCF